MARTSEEFERELVDYPENGGFQYSRLFEVLAEFEKRIEVLEGDEGKSSLPISRHRIEALHQP